MKTKKYYLFSKWMKQAEWNLDKLRAAIFNEDTVIFVTKRILNLNCEERVVATGWKNTWKQGMIGKKAVVYDYYIEIDIEGLNEVQIVAIGAYFAGFSVGRESKRYI